jgi:hypothetical protein
MRAEIIDLRCDTTIVVVTPEPDDKRNWTPQCKNAIITINSAFSESLALGIKRMIEQDQCPVCGKFNGLHGEIYHIDSMDNGEVRGVYVMCENAKA